MSYKAYNYGTELNPPNRAYISSAHYPDTVPSTYDRYNQSP
jgi:hypothetical protein